MADYKAQVKPAADQVEQPPKAGESPGLALIADVSGVSESSGFEVLIGDAGALYYMTDSTALMFNLRPSLVIRDYQLNWRECIQSSS